MSGLPVRSPTTPRGTQPGQWNGYVVKVREFYVTDFSIGAFEHARIFAHYQDALPEAERWRKNSRYGFVLSYNRAAREEASRQLNRALVGEREGRG